MSEIANEADRRRRQAKRVVIELFDGFALEAMPLNWVVCRENNSPKAPERWIRSHFYGTLGGAIRGTIEALVLENAQGEEGLDPARAARAAGAGHRTANPRPGRRDRGDQSWTEHSRVTGRAGGRSSRS